MRKLIAPLLITLMALSVLSCAGIVSAQTPKATVQPQVIGPTPQYYPVTAAPGKTYVFVPGQYNYYGTSLYRTLPGVVQATANRNGNLYAYESTKAYYANEYAEALCGVNLLIKAPATGATATAVTITVMMRLTSGSVSGSGYVEVGAFAGTQNIGHVDFTGNGRLVPQTLLFTSPPIPINPGLFGYGWNTGTTQQVGGYLTASLSGSGTVMARVQVQSIEVEFS